MIRKTSPAPDGSVLTLGDHVCDRFGDEGIVVRIKLGHTAEDHGTIHVWQLNRLEYGADNCEHYSEYRWWEDLFRMS